MKFYIQTPRVNLRELTLNDENNLLDLDSDPEVMRFLTHGKPSSREEIKATLLRVDSLLKKHSGRLGIWAALDKNSNEFMGWFHFRPGKLEPENVNKIELGYRLKKKFWGQGLATEVSKALIIKGFNDLFVNEVFAITLKSNLASRKVMEKVGLKFSHEFYDSVLIPTKEIGVYYNLTKSDFLNPRS